MVVSEPRQSRRSTEVERLRRLLAERDAQLAERDVQLAQAREQQASTSNVLRVIAASPIDLQRVLDTIAEGAARLCDSADALIFQRREDFLTLAAHYGALGAEAVAAIGFRGQPIDRQSIAGRAVVDRHTIHVDDFAAAVETEFPHAARAKTFGQRATLATPMLRQGEPIGAIVIRRPEVRPFSEQQITLLESFADQAVIAIENTRLFHELQDENTRKQQELDRARTIQQRLLPASVPAWP